MAKPVSNLRLFVAIHPSVDVAGAMIDAIRPLDLPPNRPTPVEQVHMTLQFIGDTPAKDLDGVIESVQRSIAGLSPFALQPTRVISLPERGPARLIAMETDAHPTLLELHRRLAHRLATNVRERSRERFLPHLTMCRFRSPVVGLKIDQPATLNAFSVLDIRLMRSVLMPAGAEHREVVRCALPGKNTGGGPS